MRTRLIAWYAGVLCCVLLLATVAVGLMVRRTVARAQLESVNASGELFRQFFRVEVAEYRTVEATLAHIAGELVFEDRVIDVLRPDGSHFEPSGKPIDRPRPPLRPPVQVSSLPLDRELAPGWRIEIHASGATLNAAIRRVDFWLLGGIPVVVLVAALGGWWLAGRALRPIGEMASEARQLDVASGARLTLADPTDELGRFGASFNFVLDRLDAALAQQRRFLADAAHELRSPLARMQSQAELGRVAVMRSSAEDGGASVRAMSIETLQLMERETRSASDAVDALLALARADAGATVCSLDEGFLDDVIADELPKWRETAQFAQVTLRLGTFDEVAARFDAMWMRRLVGLLLENAIQYSAPGTTVTLSLEDVGERVRLCVEDEGMGIAPAERERVFERFHRAPEARARRVGGSGIGLALARWIVQQHDGRIVATDRLDGRPGAALVAEWLVHPAQSLG